MISLSGMSLTVKPSDTIHRTHESIGVTVFSPADFTTIVAKIIDPFGNRCWEWKWDVGGVPHHTKAIPIPEQEVRNGRTLHVSVTLHDPKAVVLKQSLEVAQVRTGTLISFPSR